MDDRELLAALTARLGGAESQAPTFSALWARYWREEARGLASARDVERIGRLLCAAWDHRPAAGLATADAEDYRDARNATTTRRGGPPRPATVNRELAQARRCLQWAVEQRILVHNPLAGVRQAPEDNIRKSKIRTEEELARLLGGADRTMRALILAQIDCGFRRGEVFTLRWDQIALVNRKDRATGRMERRPIVELWRTKNRKRRRAALSARTFAAIQALPRHGPFVFVGRTPGRHRRNAETAARPGAHLCPNATLRKFQRLCARVGIRASDGGRFHFHDLRHSFAYLLRVRDRMPESAIMRQGGWLTRSAFERYGIGDEDELTDMYAIVDASIARENRGSAVRRPTGGNESPKATQNNRTKSTGSR